MKTLSDKIEIHNDFDSGDLIHVVKKENLLESIKRLQERFSTMDLMSKEISKDGCPKAFLKIIEEEFGKELTK